MRAGKVRIWEIEDVRENAQSGGHSQLKKQKLYLKQSENEN